MKTLLVLLASMTLALAAQRPDADARRASRQAAQDARLWAEIVKHSKSKPNPSAYLAAMKSKQDELKAKRAEHEKAVADRAKKNRVK